MSEIQENSAGAELTEPELAAAHGGLTIIQTPDQRVPEGVTFKPRAPSSPKLPVLDWILAKALIRP